MLTKLPSASETAKLLFHHVFRLNRIPWEILSDRGPQFISQIWKDLFFSSSELTHASQLAFTLRPTASVRGSTRYWGMPCAVCHTNHSSFHLPWLEYAHKPHVSTASGLYPFEVLLGYQPSSLPNSVPESTILFALMLKHVRESGTRQGQPLKRVS